jgi:type IV secretory pathway VirB2 component (pilin)
MGMSLLPESAFANPPTPDVTLHYIIIALTGITGKAIATISVAMLGTMALFGKLTWPRAMLAAMGIALIFGGASVVRAVTGMGANGQAAGALSPATEVFANTYIGVIRIVSGPAGMAVGTIAVSALGILALYGRITYQSALLAAMGLALVFGGGSIIVEVLGVSQVAAPAQGTVPYESVLTYLVGELTGPTSIALATLAIIALGLSALYGKISFPVAVVFVVGITLIFGGAGIVNTLRTDINPVTQNQSPDPIAKELSLVSGALTSTTGILIATLAIGALGIGAMFGKVSYQFAMVVITGIALLFGSVAIVGHPANQGGGGLASAAQTANYANANDPIVSNFSQIVNYLQDEVGISVGILAVCILGMGALFGKISFPTALVTAMGLVLLFGSVNVINWFTQTYTPSTFTGTDCFSTILQNFGINLQGDVSRALGCIAVIALGIGAMLGKVSYPTAMTLISGIGITFGSDGLITYFNLSSHTAIGIPTANGTNPDYITQILCTILFLLTGAAGKAIATIVIVMFGIGAMLGKVSYQTALIIITGLSLMFGATSIIGLLNPTAWGTNVCTGTTTLPGGAGC